MLKNELRHILNQDGTQEAEAWFECLTLRQEDDTLRVVFPHTYFAAWFSRHKRNVFEEALSRHFTDKSLPRVVYEHCGPFPQISAPQASSGREGSEGEPQAGPDDARNAEDNFASFISNAKNAFPLAAAKEIAESDVGEAYNPFLLCGRSGTGKTHLLRALAGSFARRGSGKTASRRIICPQAARAYGQDLFQQSFYGTKTLCFHTTEERLKALSAPGSARPGSLSTGRRAGADGATSC